MPIFGPATCDAPHAFTGPRRYTPRQEALPFDDATFDTVITTLVLCSVEDPDAVVAEIRRVLAPGGVLRFAEHVRSPDPTRAERQDRWAPAWCRCAGGCRPNRDTLRTSSRVGSPCSS